VIGLRVPHDPPPSANEPLYDSPLTAPEDDGNDGKLDGDDSLAPGERK